MSVAFEGITEDEVAVHHGESVDSLSSRRDEHDREQDGEQHREITLNSRTLLAIFFGLVLVCGLCFGLGFTLGKQASPASDAGLFSIGKPAATTSVSPSVEYRAKPSASATNSAASINTGSETPARQPSVETRAGSYSETGNAQENTAPVHQPADDHGVPTSVTPTALIADAPQASAPGMFMVQIAAVSNPADAAVLLSALTKKGYTVATRHEATDALLHVQIGPFPSRAEATAMRQKLLADGYNAILKQ